MSIPSAWVHSQFERPIGDASLSIAVEAAHCAMAEAPTPSVGPIIHKAVPVAWIVIG